MAVTTKKTKVEVVTINDFFDSQLYKNRKEYRLTGDDDEIIYYKKGIFYHRSIIIGLLKNNVLYISGDENYISIVTDFRSALYTDFTQITFSYQCLNQIYGKKTNSLLESKKLIIIGSDKDTYIQITEQQYKDYKSGKLKIPAGFTLFRYYLHRAGTILWKYNAGAKSQTILMGFDDDSYFACILADHPKTINAAYISLIPKNLRSRKDLKRQGEWFLVPALSKEIKNIESTNNYRFDNSYVDLPREFDSKKHTIKYNEVSFYNNQLWFEDIFLVHDDHPELEYKGWCRFERNTALASFSQEGVD